MFLKKKKTPQIDAHQRDLYEHARMRVIHKKRLFQHFILFIIGSLFFIILNLVLGFGREWKFLEVDWFVFVILIWLFLFTMHLCNVWVFSKFMGKEWTDRQMDRLILKQKAEIAKLEKEVALMYPKPKMPEIDISESSSEDN